MRVLFVMLVVLGVVVTSVTSLHFFPGFNYGFRFRYNYYSKFCVYRFILYNCYSLQPHMQTIWVEIVVWMSERWHKLCWVIFGDLSRGVIFSFNHLKVISSQLRIEIFILLTQLQNLQYSDLGKFEVFCLLI